VRQLHSAKKAMLAVAAMVAVATPLAIGILKAAPVQARPRASVLDTAAVEAIPVLPAAGRLPMVQVAVPPVAPSARFEVASVKVSPTPDPSGWRSGCKGGPGTSDPGLFTCSYESLGNLVCEAFELAYYQVAEWPYADKMYDIAAKVPSGTTRAQLREMEQNLLLERFGLKYHFEKRTMPVYELVVAKGGLKMRESPPEPPAAGAGGAGDVVKAAVPKRSSIDLRGGKWVAYQVRIGNIAAMLGGEVHGEVTDLTGLTGKYDFVLTWAGRASTDPLGLRMEEAIEGQLGLKLEHKNGPMDILVIDHLESRPTEN
jgi:uncharacterized protein (TIGR03435 family)